MALGISPQVIAQTQSQAMDAIFSAQGTAKSPYGFASLDQRQQLQQGISGFRGHGAAQHPTKANRVLLFQRRPGKQILEIDWTKNKITRQINTEKNRHLFGHGCFSQDGRFLFTTENDLTKDQGMIVVRDGNTYQWVTEFPSYGIGPHELALLNDSQTLVVANGGIQTRPETGRKKLNLADMQPNLSYINTKTGLLISQHQLSGDMTKASIRHLAVSKDDRVWMALQIQRKALNHDRPLPLVASHQQNSDIEYLDANEDIWASLNDYVGSIVVNDDSQTLGITSPRGDLALFWQYQTKGDRFSSNFKTHYPLRDVCGITLDKHKQHFILSNSFGSLRYLDTNTLKENKAKRIKFAHIHWDNHMIHLS